MLLKSKNESVGVWPVMWTCERIHNGEKREKKRERLFYSPHSRERTHALTDNTRAGKKESITLSLGTLGSKGQLGQGRDCVEIEQMSGVALTS